MTLKLKQALQAKQDATPPIVVTNPGAGGSADIPADRIADFFAHWKSYEDEIAEMNACKKEMMAEFREKFGRDNTEALRLACKKALRDPEKAERADAIGEQADTYLAIINQFPTNGVAGNA
jgi:hypothetical protein